MCVYERDRERKTDMNKVEGVQYNVEEKGVSRKWGGGTRQDNSVLLLPQQST